MRFLTLSMLFLEEEVELQRLEAPALTAIEHRRTKLFKLPDTTTEMSTMLHNLANHHTSGLLVLIKLRG